MCMTKIHQTDQDCHSYKDVHDEYPFKKKWIVIRPGMCMTKTHSKRKWIVIRTEMCMTKTNMDMDSHSYRNVHDENPYTMKWIVIRIEM